MSIFDQLGRALRWLREGRGVRQYQIAEAAGITKAMLSAYETGRQRPSLETLGKILAALDCDLRDLHQALEVYHIHPPKEARRPEVPVPPVPSVLPVVSEAPPRAPSLDAAEISSLLGLEPPLSPDDERALGEVLASFHKLLRHLHRSTLHRPMMQAGSR